MTDLVGGQIATVMTTIVAARGHIEGGRAIVLATAASAPTPIMPGVPTIAETVPGYASDAWLGVLAPARTPPAVLARLNGAIGEVLRQQGSDPAPGSAEEFSTYLRAEYEKYGRLVRQVELKPD